MAGPDIGLRLADNLYFDARAAWGTSDNEISPYGTYVDAVDTSRSLYRLGLTGEVPLGKWTLKPSAKILRFREESDAYLDSNGVDIPALSIQIGRLTFGPTLTKMLDRKARFDIAPRIGVEGLWDFSGAEIIDIGDGYRVIDDKVRARIFGGADIRIRPVTIGTEAFYDGIGASGYSAYGAKVTINFGM